MNITLEPGRLGGDIPAIPSKSHIHRLLICAALSGEETRVVCPSSSEDIDATVRCLEALCADITCDGEAFRVKPEKPKARPVLDCGESGSTYRFLFPVACALGADASFLLKGRLPERPMEALFEALEAHGITITGKGSSEVRAAGRLTAGAFTIPGDISSQFISGLLFALPLLEGDSEIRITGKIESKKYIGITLEALKQFGIRADMQENRILVPGSQVCRSPGAVRGEGDWSNAAFWCCAALVSGGPVRISGLSPDSPQGDKEILDICGKMGAEVQWEDDSVTLTPGSLQGIGIDVSDVPDLVPAIAAAACAAKGTTRILGAGRLRIKESDRLQSVTRVLQDLGADITEGEDSLTIRGGRPLKGGTVDSWGDHRIAMMAAITAPLCTAPLTILRAEAVNKSYPGFFEDYALLNSENKEQKS